MILDLLQQHANAKRLPGEVLQRVSSAGRCSCLREAAYRGGSSTWNLLDIP